MAVSAPVSTTDCALALAISVERADFLDDLSMESPREYAKFYRAERGGAAMSPDALWSARYGPEEADRITAVMRSVEALGVEVRPRCTLTVLSDLVRRKS